MMTGKIVKFQNNILYGYAYNSLKLDERILVDVLVNGEKGYTTECALLNSDLIEKEMHPTGLCGFKVSLDKNQKDIHEIRVICKSTSYELENSPVYPSVERYFFMHIPKTAGTSLRKMLCQSVPAYQVFPNTYELSEMFEKNYLSRKELSANIKKHIKPAVKYIFGHYNVKFIDEFVVPPKVVTFMRDPIRRAISHLRHFHKHNAKYKSMSIGAVLNDLVQAGHIADVQSRCMLGGAWNKPDMWPGQLDKYFFIGTDFNHDVQNLWKKLGLEKTEVLVKNTALNNYKPDHKLAKKLEELNIIDIKLFNFIKTRSQHADIID